MWAVCWGIWTGFFRDGDNKSYEAKRTARAKAQKPGVHSLARYQLDPEEMEQG